jgi:hypothetical protein
VLDVPLPPPVAPFGVAPPPVGPVAPPDVPLFPPPELPEDELPPLPEVPELPEEPDEPEDELPLPEEAEADGAEPLEDDVPVVPVVPVVAVVALVVVAGAALMVCVGTVNGGAPDVSVVAVPPPHAASAAHAPRPATAVAAIRASGPRLCTAERRVTTETSDVERLHAPPAVRAIVQVLLAQLVAPVAEAKVLDGPGQLGRRRGEGQELRHDLERLAGVAVDVRRVGLGLDHDLPPARRRSHPVPLARPH